MDANVAIVNRWTGEMWSRGQYDAAAEYIADDVLDHDALPGQPAGREGLIAAVTTFRAAFPDLTVTNEDVIVSGNKVAVRWTATGTHEGELMGTAPTGRSVRLKGIDIVRIADGKIAERWGEWDALALMAQLQNG